MQEVLALVHNYLKYNSFIVTIQVTLLFQGSVQDFLEDGVFIRWFLGKFASGSCLAMENQTEQMEEKAESSGIRAPVLQDPDGICVLGGPPG